MTGLSEITLKPATFENTMIGISLIILLLLSGLVSGSEASFFSLKPNELESLKESESSKDKTVLKLLDEPQQLLATILIANNLINVSIVMLSAFFSANTIDYGNSTILKFIIETIVITIVLLFFGEIMPKIYASSHRLKFARFMAFPLSGASKILSPFAKMLMKSTNAVNNRLAKHRANVSQDDISQALELTSDTMTDEKDMLEGIVKFMDLEVCDIMTPRIDVVSVNYDYNFNKLLQVIIDSGYSRLPVIGDKPDDIKGIIYVKDVLKDLHSDDSRDWHSSIRKCYFVPETKKVNDLLTEFQSTKKHMAIIVDEYGGMQGIITLEDIIEEIVGDISDEQDNEEKDWYKQPDGSIIFEGKISLNDFFKVIDVEAVTFDKVRGDAETLAGLLLEKNGIIPKKKDIIEIGNYKFEILSADIRKINKVKMTVKSDIKNE